MEAESARHGLTPGQHSFRLPPRRGVEAGDYLQTFKTAVKRIAKRHGLHATFMPKPNMSGDGSGLHVGMTIRRTDGSDAGEAAARFRVGILKNLYNMMIFTNPMINSYKRLAASRGSVFQPEFPAAAWEKGSDKAVRLTGCSERGASLEALSRIRRRIPTWLWQRFFQRGLTAWKMAVSLRSTRRIRAFRRRWAC